jgi:hypothetical protein
MIGAMTGAAPGTGTVPAVTDHAAVQAHARDQARHAAADWLTTDRTDLIGQQLVRSITSYRRAHRQSPTWAQAMVGVDPALCEPMTTVPDGWPLRPALWRRELRQHLMGELRRAGWITYTRTPRSLQPGAAGQHWLHNHHPTST